VQGALVHARSIERRPPRFNAICALAALLALLGRPAAAIDVPGTAGRLTVDGFLDGLAVAETEDSQRQRPQAILVLRADATGSRRLRAHLDMRGSVGGPFEGGHPGFLNLVHEFQNRAPSAEVSEAWVEASFADADVRAGLQRFAWGKLDGVPPTDVLNPSSYHDPIVRDAEERKIGVPALSGTYYFPDVERLDLSGLRGTLVYVPMAVPSRLPLIEERWFPGSTIAGSQIVIPKGLVRDLMPGVPVTHDQVIPLLFRTRNHRPPLALDAGGIGVRLGGTMRGADWDLYQYSGPSTAPDLDLRTVATSTFARTGTLGGPYNLLGVTAHNTFRQAHDVLHMVGADASRALGAATVRVEAAYFRDRPFLRLGHDLVTSLPAATVERITSEFLKGRKRVAVPIGDLFLDLDAFEWGIGADYLVHGFLPLLQVSQIVILEPAPRLVIGDPDTRFTASVRRSFLAERLEVEFRGVYAIQPSNWFFLPRVSYLLRDDLRLRLGFLAIGGSRNSLIGQYGKNDEVVMQARYSF
jgi:hypothetical protein